MDDMSKSVKSFWERPEGKTGYLFLALLMGAGLYGAWYLLPFLIIIATNTLHLLLLCGAIGTILFLVCDKRVRTLIGYMYKSLMRKLTGLVIEIDPIGILKNYASNLKEQLEVMQKSIGNLQGQIRKLRRIIEDNEEKRKHSLQLAGEAKKKDQKPAFILQSRQAGRLGKSNITLQALLTKMEMLDKVLKKMFETSQFLVQDLEGEIEVKSQERAAIQASYGAFTAAKKIIQGDGDQREIFDQTMEKLADDYAMKIGEIETFMEVSDGFIKSVDLENGIYEADALVELEKWEKKTDQLLLDNSGVEPMRVSTKSDATSKVRLAHSSEDDDTVPLEEADSSFDDLFNRK